MKCPSGCGGVLSLRRVTYVPVSEKGEIDWLSEDEDHEDVVCGNCGRVYSHAHDENEPDFGDRLTVGVCFGFLRPDVIA